MKGDKGDPGSPGPAGFNGVARRTAIVAVPPSSNGSDFSVGCVGSEKVVGGGFVPEASLAAFVTTYQTHPTQEGWKVRLGNTGNTFPITGTVVALCVAG